MESIQNTATTLTGTGKKKASLTPRELINYHIENPEEPITDEDIQNLVFDTSVIEDNRDSNADTEE